MEFTNTLVECFTQHVDIFLLLGRDEQALQVVLVLARPSHPCLLQVVERQVLLGDRRQVVGLLLYPCIGS